MKICYLGSELKTHLLAVQSTLDCLRDRGHTIEVRIWHYGKEAEEITFSGSDADLFLSDGYYRQADQPMATISSRFLWISISHGISPYKPWGCSQAKNATRIRLVPTARWATHAESKKSEFSRVVATDGWSKMDLYARSIQNTDELKPKLYNKYHFDPQKPLVVYAPTGVRQNAMTKTEWVQQYGTEKGYGWHGSYYHRDKVMDAVLPIANYYEIPHPTISRSDDIQDRVGIMAVSDLFIGDISSMSLEYTCVDKPILLLKKHIADHSPLDFHLFGEKQNSVVDLGDIVGIDELKDAIAYRLDHDDYMDVRREWRNMLLGTVDNKCGEREADAIESLFRQT